MLFLAEIGFYRPALRELAKRSVGFALVTIFILLCFENSLSHYEWNSFSGIIPILALLSRNIFWYVKSILYKEYLIECLIFLVKVPPLQIA